VFALQFPLIVESFTVVCAWAQNPTALQRDKSFAFNARLIILKNLEWQRIGNQIDAAFIFTGTDFVNVLMATCCPRLQLFHNFIQIKGGWLLARREFLERGQELPHILLCRD
jgi:hypothetical protein